MSGPVRKRCCATVEEQVHNWGWWWFLGLLLGLLLVAFEDMLDKAMPLPPMRWVKMVEISWFQITGECNWRNIPSFFLVHAKKLVGTTNTHENIMLAKQLLGRQNNKQTDWNTQNHKD